MWYLTVLLFVLAHHLLCLLGKKKKRWWSWGQDLAACGGSRYTLDPLSCRKNRGFDSHSESFVWRRRKKKERKEERRKEKKRKKEEEEEEKKKEERIERNPRLMKRRKRRKIEALRVPLVRMKAHLLQESQATVTCLRFPSIFSIVDIPLQRDLEVQEKSLEKIHKS